MTYPYLKDRDEYGGEYDNYAYRTSNPIEERRFVPFADARQGGLTDPFPRVRIEYQAYRAEPIQGRFGHAYHKSYLSNVDNVGFPKGYKIPTFFLFSAED